jgi:hypothetical protein
MSELFTTSVGIIQRDAPLNSSNPAVPVTHWTEEQLKHSQHQTQQFIKNISIDLISSYKRTLFENL